MFTLIEFECLGACDRAPVVMVNNDLGTSGCEPDDAGQLVDDIRAKGEAALHRLPPASVERS